MKKNVYQIILAGIFFLTACGGTAPVIQTQPVPVIDNPTATPSALPTTTQTSVPTATPTPSITPLPTVPTFTPTFDARTIVTVTPAPQAECPRTTSLTDPDTEFLDLSYEKLENRIHAEENILNFLNKYGDESLYKVLQQNRWAHIRDYKFKDFTNDRIPELAIGAIAFYIFGCNEGEYAKILELEPDAYLQPPKIISVRDVNLDGIPDITLLLGFASQGGHSYGVYEWNGEKFASIVFSNDPNYPENGFIWAEATGDIHYEDINHDFVQELILDSGIPVWSTYVEGLPWRNKRTIYQWNGRNYAPTHYEFAIPEFRFQAIQDGDLATDQSEFDKALSLYQDAIFSDKLKSYSPDIRKNLQDSWMAQVGNVRPTPTPIFDNTEYPRLAAYAYYRIMLLHIVQEHESDAGTVYKTLQQKFGNNPYGQPYTEMATMFLDAYQSTRKMYDGCAAAIQYAAQHPEILIPLGSNYHGDQSHTYVPADVCPFR